MSPSQRSSGRCPAATLAAAGLIAVGLAALTFLWGFVDGMNQQMVTNTTRYFAAVVQVHLKGYHDDPSLDRAIEAGTRMLDAVAGDPAVAAATARLESTVLASSASAAIASVRSVSAARSTSTPISTIAVIT